MKNLKTLLLLAAMSLCSASGIAHDFEVDGICYTITSKTDLTVGVSIFNNGSVIIPWYYSGDLVIPENVSYNGETYSVTSIEDAFESPKLTSAFIPKSIMRVDSALFANCSNLISIVVDENNPIYDSRDNCNAVIETSTNVLIGGCQTTIIPNSVVEIGNGAFWGCVNLTNITIPASVTNIGGSAFADCRSLADIDIPESVIQIGSYAFQNCHKFTSIVIPESVKSIGDGVFKNCSSLININDIIESWTVIPKDMFSGCSSLTNLVIPESINSIGSAAFSGCSKLTNVNLPKSLTIIPANLFNGCSNLVNITIPNSVTSIGAGAFEGCN